MAIKSKNKLQKTKNEKVMVCSGGRYESQANAQIREAIISGWESVFGEGNVISTNIAGAAAAIEYIKPKIVFSIGSYLPESTYLDRKSVV